MDTNRVQKMRYVWGGYDDLRVLGTMHLYLMYAFINMTKRYYKTEMVKLNYELKSYVFYIYSCLN